jgi:DnaJ-domain-containing protein 1
MITKMLMEILQAIFEDPTVRRLLGSYDFAKNKDKDIEAMMDDLGLKGDDRVKFRKTYQEYQADPNQTYEKYKYKYEPKSNSAADKFDAYFQKFEDQAKAHEEKFGKGTGDWRHRQYQKHANQNTNQSNQSNFNDVKKNAASNEEKKHYEVLDLKEGAAFEEIKAAYKTAMKKYHPDKFSDATQKKHAESLSAKINVAYDYFKKKFNKT